MGIQKLQNSPLFLGQPHVAQSRSHQYVRTDSLIADLLSDHEFLSSLHGAEIPANEATDDRERDDDDDLGAIAMKVTGHVKSRSW